MIGLRARKRSEVPPPAGAAIGEGAALLPGPDAKPAPITVPDTDREGHIFTMGRPRGAERPAREAMIEHDIRAGRSILWIDPRGTTPFFRR